MPEGAWLGRGAGAPDRAVQASREGCQKAPGSVGGTRPPAGLDMDIHNRCADTSSWQYRAASPLDPNRTGPKGLLIHVSADRHGSSGSASGVGGRRCESARRPSRCRDRTPLLWQPRQAIRAAPRDPDRRGRQKRSQTTSSNPWVHLRQSAKVVVRDPWPRPDW